MSRSRFDNTTTGMAGGALDGYRSGNTDLECRKAVRAVMHYATDALDAVNVLEMLGLDPMLGKGEPHVNDGCSAIDVGA